MSTSANLSDELHRSNPPEIDTTHTNDTEVLTARTAAPPVRTSLLSSIIAFHRAKAARESGRGIPEFEYVEGPSICDEIEPRLYLGSLGSAANRTQLQLREVTHVVTVLHGSLGEPSHRDLCDYLVIPLPDTARAPIAQHFDKVHAYIDAAHAANGVVLVHCFAGVSRSATMVVSYLMKKHRWTLRRALAHVRQRRPVVEPNAGFLLQLKSYERELGIVDEEELALAAAAAAAAAAPAAVPEGPVG